MLNILCVGAGGFLGSVLRYLLGLWVLRLSNNHIFPFATLTVNSIGCFAIGLLAGLVEAKYPISDNFRLFIFVGFLGGFTTFSTFGHETMQLFRGDFNMHGFLNIIAHIVLCLAAAWFGYAVSKGI